MIAGRHFISVMTCLTLGLMVLLMLIGMSIPVYVDELLFRMQLERFFLEGGQVLTPFPQCADHFASPPPLTQMPGAMLLGILYPHGDMLWIRLLGVLCALLWFGGLWMLLARHEERRPVLFATLVAVQMLGVMPFLLVLSRPEQWMVLCLATFVLLPQRVKPGLPTMAGFMLLVSLFYFSHASALYFTPLLLVSALMLFGVRWGWLPFCFIFFAALQTFLRIQQIMDCPQVPQLVETASKVSIPLSLLAQDPIAFIMQGVQNIGSNLSSLLHHAQLAENHQSNWLPAVMALKLSPFVHVVNVVMVVSWAALAAIAVWTILRRPLSQPNRLALALLVSLAGMLFHYNRFHFYGVSLIMPLLVLLLVLAAPPLWVRMSNKVAGVIMALGVFSASLLLLNMAPELYRNAIQPYATIPGQPHSYQTWMSSRKTDEIAALSAQCEIEPSPHDMVLDDASYPLFRSTPRPVFATMVHPDYIGTMLRGRLREFLLEQDSSGWIGRCDYLPAELGELAVRKGGFCCVSRAALRKDAP